MDLKYFFHLTVYIMYTTSTRVWADSDSDDDSCEDSNSTDYDSLCEQYLEMTRCRNNFGPVCGSNGRTYRSEYQLARAACSRDRDNPIIFVSSRGSCRSVRPVITVPPVQPNEPRPPPPARNPCNFQCPPGQPHVCGSDGVVYESRCHLRLFNCRRNTRIIVNNEGLCDTKTATTTTKASSTSTSTAAAPTTQTTILPSTSTVVTIPTSPVTTAQTGGDPTVPTTIGIITTPTATRGTPRQFGGDNTPQPGRGDTPCNNNCPDGPEDGSAAVCGTDGQTYENECHLLVQQCQADRSLVVAYRGACITAQRLCPPTSICPREYLPICGTGNITYPSLCHFQIAACLAKDDSRKVLLAGECPQDSKNSCPSCPRDIDEVCGTDNVTYTSECALREISCRENRSDLTVAYLGKCLGDQECPDTCTDVVDPVCATNGKTYSSLCALSVEACKNQETSFTVAYRGICTGDACNVECPDIYEPLCDNKGTTYQNACQLWIAICRDPMLTRKLDQEGCNLAIP